MRCSWSYQCHAPHILERDWIWPSLLVARSILRPSRIRSGVCHLRQSRRKKGNMAANSRHTTQPRFWGWSFVCQTAGCTLSQATWTTHTSTHSLTTAHRNAQFTPHALLHMPKSTRAYRNVFPTLLVASFEHAFLYDVRTGSQIQILEGIQTTPPATGLGNYGHVADSSGEHEAPSPHDAEDQDMPLDLDHQENGHSVFGIFVFGNGSLGSFALVDVLRAHLSVL